MKWWIFLENQKNKIHRVIFNKRETDDDIPDHIHVTYSINEAFSTGSLKTNVAVAAFVTAQARITLYDELFKLGKNLLYCDKDSIVFVSKPSDYFPKTGSDT